MPPRERHKRKRSKLRHSRDISLPPLASWATIRKLNDKGRLIMALPVSLQLRYWGVAAAVLGLVLWFLGDTLLPFILGGAIAYLLDPIADRMERWGAVAPACHKCDHIGGDFRICLSHAADCAIAGAASDFFVQYGASDCCRSLDISDNPLPGSSR